MASRHKNDLASKRFGKLTVIEYSHSTPAGDAIWNCICDCGNATKVRRRNLITNRTTSCGCVSSEHFRKVGKSQSGDKNYSWKGGHNNAGSLAWANKRICGSRQGAKRFGYKPVENNPYKIQQLWNDSNGVCAATGITFDAKHKPALDHCHLTTKARGFICQQANAIVGLANESPDVLRKIADYIEHHNESDRASIFCI